MDKRTGSPMRLLTIAALMVVLLSPPAVLSADKETKTAASEGRTKTLIDPLSDDNFGKEPTYIKSDSMTLKSEERVFIYSGNVEVRQGDMTLTCDTLDGKYNQQNRIEQMVARNNVVIIKGDGIRASGQTATYDGLSETVVLTDSPELQQNESVLTADQIRIFLKENRSVAEGMVRVKLIKKQEGGKPDQFLGFGAR